VSLGGERVGIFLRSKSSATLVRRLQQRRRNRVFGGLCVSEVQKGGGTFQENRGFRVGSTTGMLVSVLFLRGCVLAGSFCKSLRIVTSWDF
jgi:hypothetical protein